jgi:hypothetical protein
MPDIFDHDHVVRSEQNPSNLTRRLALATTSAAIAAAALRIPEVSAQPPDPESEFGKKVAPFREWIVSRKNTKDQTCCSMADGREPAKVRYNIENKCWEALITSEVYGSTATNTWVPIPDYAEVTNVFGRYQAGAPNFAPTEVPAFPVVWWYDKGIRCYYPGQSF